MSHSVTQPLNTIGLRAFAFAALFVVAASAVGLAAVTLLMDPPARELLELTAYFVASASISLVVGWVILRALELSPMLSLQRRAVFGAVVGGGVALLNVFVVAQLMFINTGHDLRLLGALVLFGGIASLSRCPCGRRRPSPGAWRPPPPLSAGLASGDLAVSLSETGPRDELHQLAKDVNTLAARLREADEQRTAVERERRDLTAAISHDLRTPLANIRAMVEALADGLVTDSEGIDRYHQRLKREVDRLDSMIDDLFELAQLDAGALQLNRRPLALQETASEVVEVMQVAAAKADVRLALSVNGNPPACPLMAHGWSAWSPTSCATRWSIPPRAGHSASPCHPAAKPLPWKWRTAAEELPRRAAQDLGPFLSRGQIPHAYRGRGRCRVGAGHRARLCRGTRRYRWRPLQGWTGRHLQDRTA